jgi:membrane protease YdiL (CAAX protease family)
LSVADHLLAGLIALLCAGQLFLRIDLAAHSRAVLYRGAAVSGLLLGLLPLLHWAAAGRSLAHFGLGGWVGRPLPVLASAALWLLLLILAYRLARQGRWGEFLLTVYRRLRFLMPRTGQELRASWRVSALVGSGEEIAFRGFLLWYAAVNLGLAAGFAVASLLFAAAHAYQGRLGMIFAGSAGLFLGLAYLASGSLLLAMWIHATYNMASFALGRRLLAGEGRAGSL